MKQSILDKYKARYATIYMPEPEPKGRYDLEHSHIEADQLMSDLVRELGYGEIADIFDIQPKWYA